MNDNRLFDKRESSEVIEDESVHKTAEEWEEGKWGYFEEFCLEAKVIGSSVKIRVKMGM